MKNHDKKLIIANKKRYNNDVLLLAGEDSNNYNCYQKSEDKCSKHNRYENEIIINE